MKQPIIKHTAIKDNPLIEIITKAGENYGVSYSSNSRKESSIEYYDVKHNIEFPLERIIQDYITHYGITEAVKILIGKGVINSENRSILII